MGPKKLNYLFLAAAALLLVASSAEGRHPVPNLNQFCRTSSFKRLCNRMVGNAATWHDASANAMKVTLQLAHRMNGVMSLVKHVTSNLEPNSQQSIIATCTEDFDSTIDDLEQGLRALDANDMGTLTTHLSAAYNSDCSDALKEFGISDPIITRLVKILSREVDNCLAVVRQI